MAFIDSLATGVTEPAVSDDPADFPAQYAADKTLIVNSFPNVTGAVTATHTELNQLDGVVPVITTTNQSIGGAKTFTASPTISLVNPFLNFEDTDGASGETKSRIVWYEGGFLFRTLDASGITKQDVVRFNDDGTFVYNNQNVHHDGNFQAGVDYQAYDADIPTVAASQAEMEAGTETALRSMSPLRVAQAISSLSSGLTEIAEWKIPANAASTDTWTITGYYRVEISGMLELDTSGASLFLQARVAAGTWRNLGRMSMVTDSSDDRVGFHIVITNVNTATPKAIMSISSTTTGPLDDSDNANSVDTGGVFGSLATWNEAWDEVKLTTSTGNIEGDGGFQGTVFITGMTL